MGTYGNLIRDPGTAGPEDFFMIPLGLGFAETPCLGIESFKIPDFWPKKPVVGEAAWWFFETWFSHVGQLRFYSVKA